MGFLLMVQMITELRAEWSLYKKGASGCLLLPCNWLVGNAVERLDCVCVFIREFQKFDTNSQKNESKNNPAKLDWIAQSFVENHSQNI